MADYPTVPIIDGKKTFIPLENNPETLSQLATKFGASSGLSFHDVFSFSEPALLSLVPRPVLSLIFLAPRQTYRYVREHATPAIPDQRAIESSASTDQSAAPSAAPSSGTVTWIPQTIGHACGTMSLVHALSNGPARSHVQPNSLLSSLLSQMQTQNPDERAQTLYDSLELERAHMTVAVRGDSRPPDPREDNALHFITFVKDRDGGLWELEGGVQGPILRGTLEQNEDCLSERAIQLGVGKFLHASERTGELEVSCVAVVAESGRGGERG